VTKGEAHAGRAGQPGEGRDGAGTPEAAVTSGRARWRRPAIVVGALVLVLAPIAARVTLEGRAELAAADEASARGDLDAEIEHLGRALRWRMPGFAHDEEALERLWALGGAQEARGAEGRDTALAAYRELREGLLATRAFGIPHRERWEAANDRIAALMAEQERAHGTDISGLGDPEGFHRALLAKEPGPDPVRGNLAALAFAGWVACTAGLLVQGLDPRGRLRPRPALRWGLGAVLCLVAWAVLLATAHG
jgi:hypothetical protein